MNIVLTTAPSVNDKHGVRSLPPLSIGYIAGGVKHLRDTSVGIVDAYGEGLSLADSVERVLALSPDVMGVSATNVCFEDAISLVRRVKQAKPDVVTVMGGYHPTSHDHLLLKEVRELDMVIRGEGDESFRELCERLQHSDPIDGLAGLSYRAEGMVVRGVPRQVEDLDSLPFPDRAALDFAGYYSQFGGFLVPEHAPTANVVSSRGCPYHCVFCSKLMPNWSYRTRSAENLFKEILELRAQGIKWIFFQDENFSHDVARLEKLCRLILDNNLGMRFMFQGTIHHLTEPVFRLMHDAGFDFFLVGIESGSDAQLKRFGKPARSKNLGAAVRRAKKAHMMVFGFFVHGGPGETEEDFAETVKFVREVRPHAVGGEGLWLHAGSPLWAELVGDEEVQTLEATRPRALYKLPGQTNRETLERRIGLFQEALAKSWLHWTRILEIVDLFIHNGTFRYIALRVLWNVRIWSQLLRGGPK
ncbi:MAG: radical SAM protein [Pseudomonadota bacterium]